MFWKKAVGLLVLSVILAPSLSNATAIDVSVEPSDAYIGIGERTTLTFYAQVNSSIASAENGLFSWALDVVIEKPDVLTLDPDSVDRVGWLNDPMASSSGSVMSWGLQGVYDGVDENKGMGLGQKVKLFSVDVVGALEGISQVFVRADTSEYADPDFQTWNGDLGGDYSFANATITVPEPVSIMLLGVGGVIALMRKR